MRRCFGVLAAVWAFCGVAEAQQVPWANRFFTHPEAPPPIVLHDFGTVPKGTLLRHSFPISNIYKWPMRISKLKWLTRF